MSKHSLKTPRMRQAEHIVGREREKKLLLELMRSKKAEFIAVYGRRRVGKTYLINASFRLTK